MSGDFSRYIKCCASKAHMRFDTERLASILFLGFDTQTLSQEADTSYTGKHVKGLLRQPKSGVPGLGPVDPVLPPR